jgi:hypothetical protein
VDGGIKASEFGFRIVLDVARDRKHECYENESARHDFFIFFMWAVFASNSLA